MMPVYQFFCGKIMKKYAKKVMIFTFDYLFLQTNNDDYMCSN